MKKILFVASLVIFCLSANAQQAVGTLTYQPKVGLNIARNTDMEGIDPRLGLAAGTELEYQIKERFSVAAGVLYSMQGYKTTGMTGYGFTYQTIKLDYINIPIVANVYLYKGLALKFGVQPGFNISSKITFSWWEDSKTGPNNDLDVKTFDLAIPVGLSYETKFGLVFDARYNIGVTKAFYAPFYGFYHGGIDEGEILSSRNCVFQLTVGYKFKL